MSLLPLSQPTVRKAEPINDTVVLEQIPQIAMQQASAVGQLYRRVVQRHQPAVGYFSPIEMELKAA